jgi:hypothetical protein
MPFQSNLEGRAGCTGIYAVNINIYVSLTTHGDRIGMSEREIVTPMLKFVPKQEDDAEDEEISFQQQGAFGATAGEDQTTERSEVQSQSRAELAGLATALAIIRDRHSVTPL